MLKEFDNINKENINEIKNLSEKKEELNNKIKTIENEKNILKKKLEENDNELNLIKKKLLENIEFLNLQKNNNNEEEYEEEEEYENESNKINSEYMDSYRPISNKFEKLRRNNYYYAQINRKNLDDLDAIYFFDRINANNTNGKIVINKNDIENVGNDYNFVSNDGEVVPHLNLDPKYIEDCKNKEIQRIDEEHLTPFQRIALKFEMS